MQPTLAAERDFDAERGMHHHHEDDGKSPRIIYPGNSLLIFGHGRSRAITLTSIERPCGDGTRRMQENISVILNSSPIGWPGSLSLCGSAEAAGRIAADMAAARIAAGR